MTKLKLDAPKEFETSTVYRGKPLVVTLSPLGVSVRVKRQKTDVFVPWDAVYELGWKIQVRREKQAR